MLQSFRNMFQSDDSEEMGSLYSDDYYSKRPPTERENEEIKYILNEKDYFKILNVAPSPKSDEKSHKHSENYLQQQYSKLLLKFNPAEIDHPKIHKVSEKLRKAFFTLSTPPQRSKHFKKHYKLPKPPERQPELLELSSLLGLFGDRNIQGVRLPQSRRQQTGRGRMPMSIFAPQEDATPRARREREEDDDVGGLILQGPGNVLIRFGANGGGNRAPLRLPSERRVVARQRPSGQRDNASLSSSLLTNRSTTQSNSPSQRSGSERRAIGTGGAGSFGGILGLFNALNGFDEGEEELDEGTEETILRNLESMGYTDRLRNRELLRRFGGDINRVLDALN